MQFGLNTGPFALVECQTPVMIQQYSMGISWLTSWLPVLLGLSPSTQVEGISGVAAYTPET
jgi:hypothetical protein